MNSQSICARKLTKIDELRKILSISNVDIACICETWLRENINDAILKIPGYNIVRNDREGRIGGGIAIFLKKGISFHVIAKSLYDVTDPQTEYLVIEINVDNKKILIAAFYNPPGVDCSDLLNSLLVQYGFSFTRLCLVGDFNTNLLDNESTRCRNFIDTLASHHMISHGNEPTFFHQNGASQLDLIITNNELEVLKFNQVEVPMLSRHDLVFASLNISSVESTRAINYRDYSNIDLHGMTDSVNSFDWTSFYGIDDPNILVDLFNNEVKSLHERFVPLRTFTPRAKYNPWFNHEIGRMMVDRDLAFKQWKGTGNPESHVLYKRLRNAVTNKIQKAKEDYYRSHIDTGLPQKHLWCRLRTIGVGKANENIPVNFSSEEINARFMTNYTPPCRSATDNMRNYEWGSFRFHEVNEFEVINAIHEIKSNAVGLDEIPLKFLKIVLPLLITPISFLFNKIISSGSYPSVWKYSKVVPIRKKATVDTLENLRPISILCVLSKAFERLLKNQIFEYINQNNFLSSFQSGYRPKHSTKTAMLKILDDIGILVDNGKPVALVLLDFSKAFDTVSHKMLCQKLVQKFGFSCDAANLIKSYLCDRFQAVYNDNILSSFLLVPSGVPQGSILGPILFTLYINDLPNILKYCKVHIYADDVQLIFNCSDLSIEAIASLINEDLKSIFTWSTENSLSLNVNKTFAMMINDHNHLSKPNLIMNDNEIKFVETAKNLGYKINSNFEWDDYLSGQCGKIYAKLRNLQIGANFLSTEIKLKLFKSLVLPHFIECDFLLLQASARSQSKLRVALNSCIRYIFNLSRFSSVSHLQPQLIGCSFENFCKLRCCLSIHKLIENHKPAYLYDKLIPCRTSRARKFLLPRHRTVKYGNSFFVRGVAIWNSLPNSLTIERSAAVFRRRCIEHFNVV